MRLLTTKAYTFEELTPAAKETAREAYNETSEFHMGSEYMASIKALAAHFGGEMSDWEISWNACAYSSARFNMPEYDDGETRAAWVKGIRAKLKELGTFNRRTLRGNGDCALTGTCTDEDAIDGFRREFYRGKWETLSDLMQAAFATRLKAGQEESEYQDGAEAFAENCEANGYEFTEAGEMV